MAPRGVCVSIRQTGNRRWNDLSSGNPQESVARVSFPGAYSCSFDIDDKRTYSMMAPVADALLDMENAP
jgi:hypothetical protein